MLSLKKFHEPIEKLQGLETIITKLFNEIKSDEETDRYEESLNDHRSQLQGYQVISNECFASLPEEHENGNETESIQETVIQETEESLNYKWDDDFKSKRMPLLIKDQKKNIWSHRGNQNKKDDVKIEYYWLLLYCLRNDVSFEKESKEEIVMRKDKDTWFLWEMETSLFERLIKEYQSNQDYLFFFKSDKVCDFTKVLLMKNYNYNVSNPEVYEEFIEGLSVKSEILLKIMSSYSIKTVDRLLLKKLRNQNNLNTLIQRSCTSWKILFCEMLSMSSYTLYFCYCKWKVQTVNLLSDLLLNDNDKFDIDIENIITFSLKNLDQQQKICLFGNLPYQNDILRPRTLAMIIEKNYVYNDDKQEKFLSDFVNAFINFSSSRLLLDVKNRLLTECDPTRLSLDNITFGEKIVEFIEDKIIDSLMKFSSVENGIIFLGEDAVTSLYRDLPEDHLDTFFAEIQKTLILADSESAAKFYKELEKIPYLLNDIENN